MGDGGCAEAHKTKTGTKPNTEQAAQTDRSPPRPPRGNKESREDYFFKNQSQNQHQLKLGQAGIALWIMMNGKISPRHVV